MIFGMNFNSLNPIIEKEALKQVCSVINDLQENPAILFTSKKKRKQRYLPFQSGLKPTTASIQNF